MIDALFGSKTRVKLLYLFFNNPGKSFYVREITRLIDEQINSVRRELSNMLEVGVINSDSADNKLYYEVNQKYQFYIPFRAIFAEEKIRTETVDNKKSINSGWRKELSSLGSVRLAVEAGALVKGSASEVDLLVVGTVPQKRLSAIVKQIESEESREINYSVVSYDEFYYRLSVKDKFINSILTNKHSVLVDTDNVLGENKE